MPSLFAPRLQRIAPYFVIGWLLGAMFVVRPSSDDHASFRAVPTQPAEFYEPPLHPATVALGQALFSVLGLAVFSRRRMKPAVAVPRD